MSKRYSIVRFYKDENIHNEMISIRGEYTLEQAKRHCSNPESSTDEYFDGYVEAY